MECTVIAVIGTILVALCQEVPQVPKEPPAQEKQAPVPAPQKAPVIPPGKRINV